MWPKICVLLFLIVHRHSIPPQFPISMSINWESKKSAMKPHMFGPMWLHCAFFSQKLLAWQSLSCVGHFWSLYLLGRYFNETGSNCPSELPHDQQKALCDLSVAAAKCLGFQMGALHVECKFTSTGPQLIEVIPLKSCLRNSRSMRLLVGSREERIVLNLGMDTSAYELQYIQNFKAFPTLQMVGKMPKVDHQACWNQFKVVPIITLQIAHICRLHWPWSSVYL